MKTLPYCIALFVLIIGGASTSKMEKDKWISLFNGKDIKNWNVKIQHHEYNVNFGNTFRVEDGIIKVRYDQYDDVEYRYAGQLQKGAPSYTLRNSGVMFHS